MTHAEVVEIARLWLARRWRCQIVVTELGAAGGEVADAIGWQGHDSYLVECKVSRADFAADHDKPFRVNPDRGVGLYRFYMTPKGLLDPSELPHDWGLVEVEQGRARVRCGSAPFMRRNVEYELLLLASALRRIGQAANTVPGVSVKCFVLESQNRATLSIEPED